ncbi:MAG TPA: tail fiber protein, partial [Pyrinomonadaceae bacterium]|nr:tail fiber protein [Pyrinomonadaceae bacterium]
VSLYQLHPVALRSVPQPDLEEEKMSDQFVAEIRIFPFNFPPTGWAFCDGQLMPISQNTALFSLLGTTYGGDGKSTFALPDMQGNAPMQPGQGQGLSQRFLGEASGVESITLLVSEIPVHTHSMTSHNLDFADKQNPDPQSIIAKSTNGNAYQTNTSTLLTTMAFQALAPAGGGLPHNNMQPYLTLNFCIALQGIFPQRP